MTREIGATLLQNMTFANIHTKLASSHNLIFFSKSCVIQDIKTKEKSEVVEVEGGLCYMPLK